MAFVLIFLGVVYFSGIETEQIGFFIDDGAYASAGKGLAEGLGFLNLHLVTTPPQIRYPVLFPLMLSGVWALAPDFPDNLYWMGALTSLFSILGFGVVYLYLHQLKHFPAWISLGVVVACGLSNVAPTFFTAVMSESPYFFLSFLTLYWAELNLHQWGALNHSIKTNGIRGIQSFWKPFLILIILSILTFHVRVLGLCLIAAILVWMVWQKYFRLAAFYGMISLAGTVLPWFTWVQLNKPELNPANWMLYRIYDDYGAAFESKNFFEAYVPSVLETASSCIQALSDSMFYIWRVYPHILFPGLNPEHPLPQQEIPLLLLDIFQVCWMYGLFFYFLLMGIGAFRKAFESKNETGLSIGGLYLCLYMATIIFWSFEAHIPRFLLMVLPLFWLFGLQPFFQKLEEQNLALEKLEPNTFKASPKASRMLRPWAGGVMGVILLFSLSSSGEVLKSFFDFRHHHKSIGSNVPHLWDDYKEVFGYIKSHVPSGEGVGGLNFTTMYFYTHHPTLMLTTYGLFANLEKKKPGIQEARRYLASLGALGVHYVMQEPDLLKPGVYHPQNQVTTFLQQFYPQCFHLVYQTKDRRIQLFQLQNLPTSESVQE
ncbi:MAG: hypothetical protein K2X66_17765 [Cyanobacteria bacterium]|nr:hypothetical protein [Cyanobacteriota bacterium]